MRRERPDALVSIQRGKVQVTGRGTSTTLREPYWLLRVNQHLLLPGLRSDRKRIIYQDRKRYGYGVQKFGAIPIKCKRRHEEFFSDRLENILAETLGVCCRERKRGYYKVKLGQTVFIVDVHRVTRGDYHCMLYTQHNDDYIGDFSINPTFTVVYTRLGVEKYRKMFCIVVSYVLSALMDMALSRPTLQVEINC